MVSVSPKYSTWDLVKQRLPFPTLQPKLHTLLLAAICTLHIPYFIYLHVIQLASTSCIIRIINWEARVDDTYVRFVHGFVAFCTSGNEYWLKLGLLYTGSCYGVATTSDIGCWLTTSLATIYLFIYLCYLFFLRRQFKVITTLNIQQEKNQNFKGCKSYR